MPSILDFLFPKRSLSGSEGEWITQGELAHLISHPRIFEAKELKKRGMPSLDRLLAVSTYGDSPLLRKAIHTFKYQRISGLGETLRRLMAETVSRFFPLRRDACVCPVPLHFTRRFWRGFNQAEMLADGLAVQSGLPLRHLLCRIRPTGHQARRKREERLKAMKGAFAMGLGLGLGRSFLPFPNPNPNPIPFCVYLVDDLTTTGATLEECAKVLKKAGVRRIEGIVLAHG